VAVLSEKGTVVLDGRQCNFTSATVASCFNLMVQIVSMSVYTYTIGHSSSRNPTKNWATSPYFNALEKSRFIVENSSTIYHYQTRLQFTATKHIYNLPPQNTSTIYPHKTHLQFTTTKHIYNLPLQNTSKIYPHKTQLQFTPTKHIYSLPPQKTSTIYLHKTHLQFTPTKHIYNLPPRNTSTIYPNKTHLQFTPTKYIYNLPPQNTSAIYHYKTHLQFTPTQHIYNLPLQNFLFQPNTSNILNTYIYYQLPPAFFGVCYTIFRQTITLLAQ